MSILFISDQVNTQIELRDFPCTFQKIRDNFVRKTNLEAHYLRKKTIPAHFTNVLSYNERSRYNNPSYLSQYAYNDLCEAEVYGEYKIYKCQYF